MFKENKKKYEKNRFYKMEERDVQYFFKLCIYSLDLLFDGPVSYVLGMCVEVYRTLY